MMKSSPEGKGYINLNTTKKRRGLVKLILFVQDSVLLYCGTYSMFRRIVMCLLFPQCNLLSEKRNVLKRLVDVHTQELAERGVILGANGFYKNSQRRDYESISTTSSTPSYATFGTDNNNIHSVSRISNKRVPKLHLLKK